MSRDEQVQYEQDRLGNENRKIDELRAQEGMVEGDDQGLKEIQSADTGSVVLLQSKPTHADQMIVELIHGYNSVSSGGDTFSLYELTLDGAGNITDQTRRSVPIQVASGATRSIGYEGLPFDKAIGVESEFQGFVGVGFKSDHKEYNEPESENY